MWPSFSLHLALLICTVGIVPGTKDTVQPKHSHRWPRRPSEDSSHYCHQAAMTQTRPCTFQPNHDDPSSCSSCSGHTGASPQPNPQNFLITPLWLLHVPSPEKPDQTCPGARPAVTSLMLRAWCPSVPQLPLSLQLILHLWICLPHILGAPQGQGWVPGTVTVSSLGSVALGTDLLHERHARVLLPP